MPSTFWRASPWWPPCLRESCPSRSRHTAGTLSTQPPAPGKSIYLCRKWKLKNESAPGPRFCPLMVSLTVKRPFFYDRPYSWSPAARLDPHRIPSQWTSSRWWLATPRRSSGWPDQNWSRRKPQMWTARIGSGRQGCRWRCCTPG